MRNEAYLNNVTPTTNSNAADAEKRNRSKNSCKSQSFENSRMESEPTYEVPDTLETIFDSKWKVFKKIKLQENTGRRPSIQRVDKGSTLK